MAAWWAAGRQPKKSSTLPSISGRRAVAQRGEDVLEHHPSVVEVASIGIGVDGVRLEGAEHLVLDALVVVLVSSLRTRLHARALTKPARKRASEG